MSKEQEPQKERPVIEWTRPMLERFKKAHKKCTEKSFMFEGHEYVRDYAKYLIEYLETQLPK